MDDDTPSWMKNDEEEDELDETSYKSQKDAVIFAIDVSSTMLKRPPVGDRAATAGDSATVAALKCASALMQQRIISNPKDMMGVLLYGTEETKYLSVDEISNDTLHASQSNSSLKYPHCYLFTELDVPSAEDVKSLMDITHAEDEDAAKILIPTEETVTMTSLLFCALQIFNAKAPNFDSRRLFIITDNDEPHNGVKHAKSQAMVRAKDLYDVGITIDLFPISRPDHPFDRTKFYDDIIYRETSDEGGKLVESKSFTNSDGISLFQNLLSDINSKQTAKRSLFTDLPFEIGPGFHITVKGYNMLQKQAPARSCFVYTSGETPQIVTSQSATIRGGDSDDTNALEKDQIVKAYKFGGDTVYFKPEEIAQLKDFGSPVLRIIGFKPQSSLPIWASVKKSTFIYPSESGVVGSIRVFSALWRKLLDDKKIGIAWFIARKNAKPILVAILPSNSREEYGTFEIPQGLWLCQLPFADDLRSHAPTNPNFITTAPDNLKNEMRKVVQQIQLPKGVYDPSRFPNPSLQWHYKVLQAMALEEDTPSNPIDATVGKHAQIHKRTGIYVANWGKLLGEEFDSYQRQKGGTPPVAAAKKKIEVKTESDAPAKKKQKTEPKDLLKMKISELKELAGDTEDESRIRDYTVADLKSFLLKKKLKATGKKAELAERIEDWIRDQ